MYRKFKIVTKDIDSKDTEELFSPGNDIKINTVNHNMFKMNVQKFDIIDNYTLLFALCKMDLNCKRSQKLISSTVSSTDTMIVLNVDYTMYDDAYFTKTFNTINDIYSNYATVVYTVGSKTYEEKAELVTKENVNNYVFLKVNRRIKTARDVKVRFDFRNRKCYLNLN